MSFYSNYNDSRQGLEADERTRLEGNSSPYLGAHSPAMSSQSPRFGDHNAAHSPSMQNSLYATTDYGRRGSPASYYSSLHNGRPMTPGTPGTFDSGLARFTPGLDEERSSTPQQFGMDDGYAKEGRRNRSSRGAAAGAAAASSGNHNSRKRGGCLGWIKSHKIWTAVIGLVVLAIIIAAAVGGAVAGTSGGKTTSKASTSSGTVGNSHGGTSTAGNNNNNGSTSPTAQTVTPLATWNQTDPQTKVIGVSLGNWLLLERWVDENWFVSTAGADSWDEWTFTENLGLDAAKTALTSHWNSWVQESDIDLLKSAGVNSVRIPVGYWAFVPAASGEPYAAQAGQTDQITKILGWLYDRGMYAMIDLHGMPGSQNNDQASGHNTTGSYKWFNSDNIGYSYVVLNATIDFIKTNKYSSVVHSVCPVNEPRALNDDDRLATLTAYYENAYTYLKNAGLIMQFHHAFVKSPYSYWTDFVGGKDPNYIAMNDNPYPGWFPPNSDGDSIVNSVCNIANEASEFPVPVVMTEYSLVNNVNNTSYDQEYYNTEISAFSWSAGAYFWHFKTVHNDNNRVLAEVDYVMDLYSMTTLINNSIIGKIESTSSALDTIQSLPHQQCGSIPKVTWSNPAKSS